MADNSNDTPEYKFAVFGAGGIGKSTLTIRFITDKFVDDYDPTLEDSYRKHALIDGELALIDVLDTGGRSEFSTFNPYSVHFSQYSGAFLIGYSITSRASFDEAEMLREKVLRAKNYQEIPMVIIATKCDLENDRQVSKEEGIKFAKECGVPFYETSAKTKINNEECFYQLVREMRKFKRKQEGSVDSNEFKSTQKKHCALL